MLLQKEMRNFLKYVSRIQCEGTKKRQSYASSSSSTAAAGGSLETIRRTAASAFTVTAAAATAGFLCYTFYHEDKIIPATSQNITTTEFNRKDNCIIVVATSATSCRRKEGEKEEGGGRLHEHDGEFSCKEEEKQEKGSKPVGVPGPPVSLSSASTLKRTYKTQADEYYRKFGKIPLPRLVHAVLGRPHQHHGGNNIHHMVIIDGKIHDNKDDNGHVEISSTTIQHQKHQITHAPNYQQECNNHDMIMLTSSSSSPSSSHKILVIGDVHGCLDELKALVQKASTLHNDHKPFAAVILVGDLCNKGPYSAEVIQFVRNQNNWFSVRGNHDDAALAAALGDVERQSKRKYDWVASLSDEDVEWMSNLPYSITIPEEMLHQNKKEPSHYHSSSSERTNPAAQQQNGGTRNHHKIIIVHAGLIPGVSLKDQTLETMTKLRDVNDNSSSSSGCAWAQMWHGPELVIFGHDAKIGLGEKPEDGAVYHWEWFDSTELRKETGFHVELSFEEHIHNIIRNEIEK
jgi:hypothetical protein